MKSKVIVSAIFLVIVMSIGSGCTKEPDEEEMEIAFRMAEVMPKEHPSAMASQYFADLVKEKSNGRIQIEVYYNETLGDADEILDQTKYGGIAFARVNALEVIEEVISLETIYKQYAYQNPDSMMEWIASNKDLILGEFQNDNLFPLVWYYPDFRCFYNATDKINDIDDFRGLKIKTAETNLMRSSMSKLAAVAVDVDNADMYRSMKSGYINAGEASFGEFVLSDYYDLVTYVTVTNYIACPDVIVACDACMESLSQEDRELILQCARDTYVYQKEQTQLFQEKYIEIVKEEKDLFLESDNFSAQLKIFLNKNEDEN